jgi:hypothetical protein
LWLYLRQGPGRSLADRGRRIWKRREEEAADRGDGLRVLCQDAGEDEIAGGGGGMTRVSSSSKGAGGEVGVPFEEADESFDVEDDHSGEEELLLVRSRLIEGPLDDGA